MLYKLLIPYLVADDILIMNHKHVIIRNAICFSTNIQMPDKLLVHPPNIYVLELSPASTKCTYDVAIKLFCRLLSFPLQPSLMSAMVSNLRSSPR